MLSLSNRGSRTVDQYNVGLQYMQQGNIKSAITAWNQVLVARPDHIDALESRSVARRLVGDLRGALEDLNQVINRDPVRPLPYWIRGQIFGFQGQFAEAIADFEYLVHHPSSHIPMEQVNTSLEHWRKMYELQPMSPVRSAPPLTDLTNQPEPSSELKVVESISPTQQQGLAEQEPVVLFEALPEDAQKKSPEIVKIKESATSTEIVLVKRIDDEDEIVDATFRTLHSIDFVRKARLLVAEGNYRAALHELNTAIEMEPMMIDAYVERGAVYVALGATLKAQIDLDKALVFKPTEIGALVNRANVEIMAALPQNATPYIQKAFEIDPKYPPLHVAYGSFCEAEGNYAVAFAAYDFAVKLDENLAVAIFNRGRMYMKYQMPRPALADFLRTLDLQPNHARSYFSVGGIYADRGDYEIAEYYYQKAAGLQYEPAQQILKKLQQSAPLGFQPTPAEYWRTDNTDLLAQALVELAKFAYAHCGPSVWQEKVQKRSLLGLSVKSSVDAVQRWQVQLQTVNEIDSFGVSRTMQAAVLNLHQTPSTSIRVLPINSNSYSLSIWTHRGVPGMRNTIFTAGISDYMTFAWSELPGVLADLFRTGVLELRSQQLHYTGRPISHLARH